MQHCYTTLISESKNWSVGSKVASDTYSAILDTYVLLGLEAEVAELEQIGVQTEGLEIFDFLEAEGQVLVNLCSLHKSCLELNYKAYKFNQITR